MPSGNGTRRGGVGCLVSGVRKVQRQLLARERPPQADLARFGRGRAPALLPITQLGGPQRGRGAFYSHKMEGYAWLIVLGAWSLLLALGLAGGDPLAVGRPGQEAPAIKLARWAHGWLKAQRSAEAAAAAPERPRAGAPARQSGSGFHAVA